MDDKEKKTLALSFGDGPEGEPGRGAQDAKSGAARRAR